MRLALSCLVLASCMRADGARTAPVPVEPMYCDARHDDTTATRSSEAMLAHVRSLVARAQMGNVAGAVDVTAANVVDLGTTGLARSEADLGASFTETLRAVPTACALGAFDDPSRLDIPPPFAETPEEQVAPIEDARALLAESRQVTVTCDGCPMIAIAFDPEGDAPAARAWAIVRMRLPH